MPEPRYSLGIDSTCWSTSDRRHAARLHAGRLDGRVNRCETDLGHLQRVLDHAVEVGVRVRGDESRGEFGRRLAGLVRVHDRISNDLAYAVMRIDHDLDAGLLEEAA